MKMHMVVNLFRGLFVALVVILFTSVAYPDSGSPDCEGDTHCWEISLQFMIKARELDTSGKWREAVEILSSNIAKAPYTWPSLVLAEKPVTWEAYRTLSDILMREEPEKAEGYLYNGIAKAVDEDYAGAETAFTKGAALVPKNADLQFAIGWSIIRQDRANASCKKKVSSILRALPYFEAALKIDPRHKMSLCAAGYANTHLAEAINYDKGYTPASYKEIIPYMERSISYLEEYIKLYGESMRIHIHLYDICRQLKKWNSAARHLDAAIKMAPKDGNMHDYLEFNVRRLEREKAEDLKKSGQR
ncbi:MAG: hypothetical protein PHT33_10580 [bacterium]|nr:hypothetical protein [bacterium]